MRKWTFLVACLMLSLGLHAQEKTIVLHRNGQVLYQTPVSNVGGIGFLSNPASLVFSNQQGATLNTVPVAEIDSVTFGTYEIPSGDQVVITFNGNTAEIVNPFANDGVSVETSQGNVTVYSTKTDVPYLVTGSSSNGSLTIYSNSDFSMTLSYLTLTSNNAAIHIASNVNATLILEGTCTLTDSANSSINGALYSVGNLTVEGNDLLRVTGNAKHGILVDGDLTVNSGDLFILDSDSDGIHGNGNLTWNGGSLHIVSAGSDGLDVSGNIGIYNGTLEINTNAESARGIKVSGLFDMADGHLTLNTTGNDGKGLKCDSTLVIRGGVVEVNVSGEGANGISSDQHISIEDNADITIVSNAYDGKCFKSDNTFSMSGGSLHLTHSGDLSKGIKTVGEVNLSGGNIDITASGSTVLEVVNNQNVPAYCTAIKSDTDIVINGGTFHINLPTTNHGGKSISADGNLTITDGDFTIETHGDGAAYTVSGNTKDSYTSSCLKADGNMELWAGTFNLSSTGRGGKGISAGGTLKMGIIDANNDDLILNVTTSGERITVTSGGGGPWGGGDYANPKAIKSQSNLTINSGTLRVNCTQTQNEGGECIESKGILTINGGDIVAYSKKDDAVNASSKLIINGGLYYAHSDANDGTDSNGQMELNGGFCVSNGAKAPEEGFDCDNNQFKITGGTHIGTGGGTSNPTTSVCTQPVLKINTQQNYAIQILKSDGTVICTYQCPGFTGGGGGWPGGGNGMVMLFTDPQLQTGQSYTVKYNGTLSGGTNWNGYYTGNVTYSGGQSTTANVNSMVTTVNAGGNGW